MAEVAVITSIYGAYDTPAVPPEQDIPCDWILVTDQDSAPAPWQVVTEPRPQLHPRLAAKVAKAMPHLYSDAPVTVWADGNVDILSAGFAQWAAGAVRDHSLAQHLNPARGQLMDECVEATRMSKYDGLPLWEQTRHYLEDGYPRDYGVWWTGLIVRRADCPDFGAAWLAEQMRWTYEDQISQPYILWKMGLRPAPLGPWAHVRVRDHHRPSE